MAKNNNGNKPARTFRIGLVSASVFLNSAHGGEREFRNVQLQRRYRDGDEWKTSTALSLGDLPAAIRVLELALHYVEEQEAAVTP